MNSLRRALRKALAVVLGRLSPMEFELLVQDAAEQQARRLGAADALRMLLGLDSRLYAIQGRKAVDYGGGIHVKHRILRYHDFFVDRINDRETVLDIGCGNGALTHDIAKKTGARVLGVDASQANVEQAGRDHAHCMVEYRRATIPNDLTEEHFDVVVLSNVLEHIADRQSFLREIIRFTKPSRLLIRVPLFERDWRVPLKKEIGVEWRLDSTHETEFTSESFARELHAIHLRIVHQEIKWGEIWAEVSPIPDVVRR